MVEKTTNRKLEIISLFKKNYLAEFYTREIATLLQTNHVTLLPHLKSLEEDKILKTKTKGKNKIYSLNFENIITKNYILLAEYNETNKFLEEVFLIRKISKELFAKKIKGTLILFGSYAKKTFDEKSDIDILHIGSLNEKEKRKIKQLSETYGKEINIKQTNTKNFEKSLMKKDALIVEIIKNHIIIQNGEEFVNKLWRFYDERR